jgi:hypothetical protein
MSEMLHSSGIHLDFTDIELLPFGEFKVQKNYYVPQANCGKVVQIIQKSTEATDVNNITYSTTDEINALTSENVNFSNDDYVEIFQIGRDKNSTDDDAFQNGAVVPYDEENAPWVFDSIHDEERLPYLTTGKITVIGTNFYLPSKVYAIFNKKFKPKKDFEGPANGLLTTPLTEEVVDWLNKNAQYPPLEHKVVIEWDHNETHLENYIDDEKINEHHIYHYKEHYQEGGKRKKHHKMMKRQTKKSQKKKYFFIHNV